MNDVSPILVVDDEEEFLRSASFALRSSGFTDVETVSDAASVLERVAAGTYGAVLLDLMMPKVSGRELLSRITALKPGLPVIMVTAVNEVETAVGCIKDGAYDYLLKPVDKARLITTLKKALDFAAVQNENRRLAEGLLSGEVKTPGAFKSIITVSESMRALFRYLEAVAPTPFPLLVRGESGTGKELFARAAHEVSGRTGAFVAVNAAGLDDVLFSDTLFGHEKGAFTGADKRREGLVAKARHGTLFLDEIGDLKPESQVKLLRLLENGGYYPVGSDLALHAECRIIAATHAPLEQFVTEGRFRKDLYFRLCGHSLTIPPLRERPEDLPDLVRYFLLTLASELGKPVPTPPPQLFTLLSAYSFPGNVRELKAMTADAVSRHTGGVLSLSAFKESMEQSRMLDASGLIQEASSSDLEIPVSFGARLPTLKENEEALIAESMKRCQGNQSQAARLLGITPSALNKRLNK